jgi:RNA polymerase sigma factor for flagellar operon FliA
MAAGSAFQEHTELIDRIARRLHRELDLRCDLDDLRAWGHQGLLEAQARFDASRGVKLSTFAYYRARGAMLDGIRKQGFLPRRAYAKLKAFEAADSLGAATAEMPVTPEGPAARAQAIDDALGKISAAFVIAAVGQADDNLEAPPDLAFEREETQASVRVGVRALPEKERILVEAVYFEGLTIEDAGARLGLSKSWASRLHAKALERMRDLLAGLDG